MAVGTVAFFPETNLTKLARRVQRRSPHRASFVVKRKSENEAKPSREKPLKKRNTMNKLISLAFLATGILLIIFGVMAAHSLGSDISRFFTGSPTDKAIWLLIGGVVAVVVGLVGFPRGSK